MNKYFRPYACLLLGEKLLTQTDIWRQRERKSETRLTEIEKQIGVTLRKHGAVDKEASRQLLYKLLCPYV